MKWLAVLLLVACGSKSSVEHRNANAPRIAITIAAPGMSTEELEHAAATLEEAAAGLRGAAHLETRVASGSAVVVVELDGKRDLFDARAELADRVGKVFHNLPPSVSFPTLTSLGHRRLVLRYTLQSTRDKEVDVTKYAEALRVAIERAPGVDAVESCGDREVAPLVELDRIRLRASAVTTSDVIRAIEASPDISHEIVVGHLGRGAIDVRLQDVGTIDSQRTVKRCTAMVEQGPAIAVSVYARDGADLVGLRKKLEDTLAAEPAPSGIERVVWPRSRPGELVVEPGTDARPILRMLPAMTDIRHVIAEMPDGATTVALHLAVADDADPAAAEDAARKALEPSFKVHRPGEIVVRFAGVDLSALTAARDSVDARLGRSVIALQGGAKHPTKRVVTDRSRMATLGVSDHDVAQTVAATSEDGLLVAGSTLDSKSVNVHVELDDFLMVPSRTMGSVPLADVAKLETVDEPTEILHENRMRWVGLATTASESEIRAALAAVKLPPGVVAHLVTFDP